jgi:hypothetical protein
VLDEYRLHEAVGFLHVDVVVPLADIADGTKTLVDEHLAGFTERLEGVLGLARHHDVADQSQEVALTRRVREIAGDAQRGAQHLLARSGLGAELALILLEHALVLPHVRDVARAQVAKPGVLGLALVVLERLQKCLVLHDGVVHLTLEKIYSAIHGLLRELRAV